MDKSTVLLAEQVGLFLVPTIRAAVDSLVAKANGEFTDNLLRSQRELLDKLLVMAKEIEELKATVETNRENAFKYVDIGLQNALGVALKESRKGFVDDVAALRDHCVSKEMMGASAALIHEAMAQTSNSIVAVEASVKKLGETHAAALQRYVATTEHDFASLREEVLSTLEERTTAIGVEFKVQVSKLAQEVATVVEGLGTARKEYKTAAEEAIALAERPTVIHNTIEVDWQEADKRIDERVKAAVALVKPAAPLPALAPDPVMIADAVAAAVKAVELPTIDHDEIGVQLAALVSDRFDQVVPTIQASLGRSAALELKRLVDAIPAPAAGKDGAKGADGLMPLVEPYVEGYVYERGATATHAGGTWQATRRTKTAPAPNLADWQALAVGVAGLGLSVADDCRTVELKATMSDGGESTFKAALPTMIYRNVYEDDADYVTGDTVTYKGCLWTAKQSVRGVKPSDHAGEWQMSVRAGRDGKGKDGADGVQFQAGYEGEYVEGKMYLKNCIVEYASSLWLTKRATKERPPYMANQDNEHWLRIR